MEMQDLIATVDSLATNMADLIAKVIRKKKKISHSGANMIFMSDLSHFDSNTPFFRAEEPRGVKTANQSVMAISGSGLISGLKRSFVMERRLVLLVCLNCARIRMLLRFFTCVLLSQLR